jgi:hypothetical protein
MERNAAAYTQVYFQSSWDHMGGEGLNTCLLTSQQVFLKTILVNNKTKFSYLGLFFRRRKSIRRFLP